MELILFGKKPLIKKDCTATTISSPMIGQTALKNFVMYPSCPGDLFDGILNTNTVVIFLLLPHTYMCELEVYTWISSIKFIDKSKDKILMKVNKCWLVEMNGRMKYRQIGEYELTLSSTLYWIHMAIF